MGISGADGGEDSGIRVTTEAELKLKYGSFKIAKTATSDKNTPENFSNVTSHIVQDDELSLG